MEIKVISGQSQLAVAVISRQKAFWFWRLARNASISGNAMNEECFASSQLQAAWNLNLEI